MKIVYSLHYLINYIRYLFISHSNLVYKFTFYLEIYCVDLFNIINTINKIKILLFFK